MKLKSSAVDWLVLGGVALILGSALAAELYRFHGQLLVDWLVPPLVLIYIATKGKKGPWPRLLIPASFFLFFGASSLALNGQFLENGDFAKAAFYLVRWASFFLLLLPVYQANQATKKGIFAGLMGFGVGLSLLGFLQLYFVPDFRAYEILGWDPHVGRLLSTWFDPNFVGGALAYLICLGLGVMLRGPKPWLGIALAIMTVALVLTLSRSAYLAFGLGLLTLGLLASWRLLAAGTLIAVFATLLIPSVHDRILDLFHSITAFTKETYALPDPSARLRVGSWEEAWALFKQKPLLGHGYNRYEWAALDLGALKDPKIHSASGSDSSLLTVLATTGVLGFVAYGMVYAKLLATSLHARLQKDGTALGVFAGTLGLLMHSIFVNSQLFPLFMVPFWLSVGLLPLKSLDLEKNFD